jgi:UDP-glucose 4-epimerase
VIEVNSKFPTQQHIILGGLGFIGSRLVTELIRQNQICLVIDNESLGSTINLSLVEGHPNLTIILGDAAEEATWQSALKWTNDSAVFVWHLAANSDIAAGSSNSHLDVKNTFMTSVLLTDFIKDVKCTGVVFASSSAVYGELNSENGFLEEQVCTPQSYYGAAKLSSEYFLNIALSRRDIPFWIFRFANIVGSPATHGVIYDLLKKLSMDLSNLQILGDGNQCKSYLEVNDLVSTMLTLVTNSATGIWNLGPGDRGITVAEIAQLVVNHVAPNATLHFGIEPRGWLGDVPIAKMNCSKLEKLVGKNFPSSKQAVHVAIHEIASQLELEIQCLNV